MERTAFSYHTGLAHKRNKREGYKEEERERKVALSVREYIILRLVLDTTSRWAGNEVEDTH